MEFRTRSSELQRADGKHTLAYPEGPQQQILSAEKVLKKRFKSQKIPRTCSQLKSALLVEGRRRELNIWISLSTTQLKREKINQSVIHVEVSQLAIIKFLEESLEKDCAEE